VGDGDAKPLIGDDLLQDAREAIAATAFATSASMQSRKVFVTPFGRISSCGNQRAQLRASQPLPPWRRPAIFHASRFAPKAKVAEEVCREDTCGLRDIL
jgi:hypothetical protein